MAEKTEEDKRLEEHYSEKKDWLHWGSYLSERQWGTVREDYSPYGTAWDYFTHDHSRSRTYRWGEDGIAGISDRYCNICFGIALWNGKDPILKERMFGLTGPEGNHGEDVKELYYYLENTPSHSYMKHLYKYPQNEFPYNQLVEENKRRGKNDLEYELLDTGIFDNNEYFDVFTEYAKADNEDILIKITIENRSDKKAKLHLLPTLWSRNFWSFMDMPEKPILKKQVKNNNTFVSINHVYVGNYNFYFETASKLLFTENETNTEKLFGTENNHPYKKDLFHKAVIDDDYDLATAKKEGTKFSPLYQLELEAGASKVIKLRLTNQTLKTPFNSGFDAVFEKRQQESADFYKEITKPKTPDLAAIQKQALAGLLWSKLYYNYDIESWLKGDPKEPKPPLERRKGRNSSWKTLRNHDIISMPDAWEYPWYAAWDLSFHCISLALVDCQFAKDQLILFTREWYMAPNGQIPAYEWNFSDVNPPVQAWATMELYKIEKKKTGKGDINFLKRMFNKLALNFTWWVNRLDSSENNVFEGGFLGLDNIGVFDRSHGIPGGGILEQVDGTSWMALFCLDMLEMSLEIAMVDDAYEDMATKYFGHFVYIAEALNQISIEYSGTWDDKDGFFYDKLIFPTGESIPIKVKSIAGLLSIAAVLCVKKETLKKLPKFEASVEWFVKHRKKTLKYPVVQDHVEGGDLLLSLVPKDRMQVLMKALLNENEFLSDYGIRSLSKTYENPYNIIINNINYSINYEPAESSTGLFGGNSNWRGPIWMPLNYLFIQSLKEFNIYYSNSISFEYPTSSNNIQNLEQIILGLSDRLIQIFKKDSQGNRPINELHVEKYKDPNFQDLVLFYEYFHGDTGRGVGASHQTGWTALIANLIEDI
ncbi:Glycosyl hydrolase family 63 C-terminal domain-containing protein [Flaviramulus basaltis]|uniref:mannosyl-oligosaccharide glucosidase n=1 Tax=Flaviramulus basaltis TaxID=369401 RepID=A0A1K2IRC7_9FLAO|nr:glucosidase [Flaviramulus basaltis]SFZ95012.1 Glycosyl hydrolase family 63 C-terminal domain-containing protein [Flaviramulus basaltis]